MTDWTPNRHAAARKACEAATSGPWDSEGTPYIYAKVPGGRPNGEGIGTFGEFAYSLSGKTDTRANAAFTALARTDLPAALDEIERLQGLLRRVVAEACPYEDVLSDALLNEVQRAVGGGR